MVSTPWGFFGYVCSPVGLVATFLPEPREKLRKRIRSRFPDADETPGCRPAFERQVRKYFSGTRVTFTGPLDLGSFTFFRQRVLEACRRIPFGTTATYRELACAAGSENAFRAAGSTMAGNVLPLVVPCHRVICSDQSFGGFSSPRGLKDKIRLLKHEGIPCSDTRVLQATPSRIAV